MVRRAKELGARATVFGEHGNEIKTGEPENPMVQETQDGDNTPFDS